MIIEKLSAGDYLAPGIRFAEGEWCVHRTDEPGYGMDLAHTESHTLSVDNNDGHIHNYFFLGGVSDCLEAEVEWALLPTRRP